MRFSESSPQMMRAVSSPASSLWLMVNDGVGGFDVQSELGDADGEEIGKVIGVEIADDASDSSGDGVGERGGSSKMTGSWTTASSNSKGSGDGARRSTHSP